MRRATRTTRLCKVTGSPLAGFNRVPFQLHLLRSVVTKKDKKMATMSRNDTKVMHDMSGCLYSSVKIGLVIERHGDKLLVEDKATRQLRECSQRNVMQKENLVCGDTVFYQLSKASTSSQAEYQSQGVVVGRSCRHNLLYRSDLLHRTANNIKVIAANVDQLFIVVAPSPQVPLISIDQLLVAGEIYDMRPTLILNKIDMDVKAVKLKKELEYYCRSQCGGYKLLCVSAHTGEGIEVLKCALKDSSSGMAALFIGQSGVGKSSIINQLLKLDGSGEDELLDVGDLTRKGQLGAHTTTNARLLHISAGIRNSECHMTGFGNDESEALVIDSPGIRSLHLGHLSPYTLRQAFPELDMAAKQCRYRNCQHHATQRGCAVQEGIRRGIIFPSRLNSYFNLLHECNK